MSMKISTVLTGGIALLALIFSIVAINIAINIDVTEIVKKVGGVTNYDIVDVSDGYRVDGTTIIDGDGNITAETIKGLEVTTAITSTTTITASQSGTTFLLSGTGTTATLPAVTNDGFRARFVIDGAVGSNNMVIASAEGDNIDGTLIVAGAVVDCRGEDFVNFIVDGEAIGDYVEIYSNGTQWILGDSGVLTTAKATCTDPS